MPETITKAPELYPGLGLYYDAFLDLSAGRPNFGFGSRPISWSELVAYCDAWGIEGEQKQDFFDIIRLLDQQFLKYQNESKPVLNEDKANRPND